MSVARFAYWVCAVAAACCFGYAAYILLAWPDEPLDPRRTGMMAELTINRVAAFTLTLAGVMVGLMAWLLRTAFDD